MMSNFHPSLTVCFRDNVNMYLQINVVRELQDPVEPLYIWAVERVDSVDIEFIPLLIF